MKNEFVLSVEVLQIDVETSIARLKKNESCVLILDVSDFVVSCRMNKLLYSVGC